MIKLNEETQNIVTRLREVIQRIEEDSIAIEFYSEGQNFENAPPSFTGDNTVTLRYHKRS